jgi:hypothetical protein
MKAEVQARTLAHHIPLCHLVIGALDSDNQLGRPDVSESRPGNCRGPPQQHRIPASRSWDPGAIELLRQGSELEPGCPNFHIAANSQPFQIGGQSTYESRPASLDSRRVEGCFSGTFAYKTASCCPLQLHVWIP